MSFLKNSKGNKFFLYGPIIVIQWQVAHIGVHLSVITPNIGINKNMTIKSSK